MRRPARLSPSAVLNGVAGNRRPATVEVPYGLCPAGAAACLGDAPRATASVTLPVGRVPNTMRTPVGSRPRKATGCTGTPQLLARGYSTPGSAGSSTRPARQGTLPALVDRASRTRFWWRSTAGRTAATLGSPSLIRANASQRRRFDDAFTCMGRCDRFSRRRRWRQGTSWREGERAAARGVRLQPPAALPGMPATEILAPAAVRDLS